MEEYFQLGIIRKINLKYAVSNQVQQKETRPKFHDTQ